MKALQGTKIQNAFLETLIGSTVELEVDAQVITAKILAADQFHIVIEEAGQWALVSKSAVSIIRAPHALTPSLQVNIEAACKPRVKPPREEKPRPQITYKPKRTY